MVGGGCYSGPEGASCWGAWWVGLIFIGFLLLLGILAVAVLVVIARDPARFFRYYRNRRNLVVLPLTFLAYMAVYMGTSYLAWEFHLPLWARLVLGVPALLILAFAIWFLTRWARQPGPS